MWVLGTKRDLPVVKIVARAPEALRAVAYGKAASRYETRINPSREPVGA
jgi:hypothetical protein